MAIEKHYYHAGTQTAQDRTIWSAHTRRSRAAAEREAVRLAKRHGGKPVVEWWSTEHGLRPGDVESVLGAEYVEQPI